MDRFLRLTATAVATATTEMARSRRIPGVGIVVMSGISRSESRGVLAVPAWRWLIVAGGLPLALHGLPLRADDTTAIALFEKSIRPLIVAKCQSCHGEQKAKGGLRLTDRESLLRGGESGPAVVPGAADESLLIRAVRYLDEPKMPPKQKLSAGEIRSLERLGRVRGGLAVLEGWTGDTLRADFGVSRLVGVPACPERAAAGCRSSGRRGQWDRCLPPARVQVARDLTQPSGGPTDLDSSRLVRPDRAPAGPGRGRGVRCRWLACGVREARRSAPGLAGLRSTLGAALARRGPLCRLLRRRPERPAPPVAN